MAKHEAPSNGQSTYQQRGGQSNQNHEGQHRAQETTPLDDRDLNQTVVIVNGGWFRR